MAGWLGRREFPFVVEVSIVLNRISKTLGAVIAGMALCSPVKAQQYPTQPIKIIVGFAPGSGADTLGRFYGQKLSELLKTPVIVDNKAGAGQMVAIRALIGSPPDGYTLFLATGSALGQGPGIRKDLPYDPIKDFSLIAQIGTSAGAIYTNAKVPIRSVPELIAYAKSHPGKLSYSSAGVGSAGHLNAEYFMHVTGTKLFHIPYKSDAEAAREAAAGTVDMAFTLARFVVPLAAADKVRPLMAIDADRVADLPNVPSAAQVGVKGLHDMAPFTYYGFVGPVGMPANVIDRLNQALATIASAPDTAIQLQKAYVTPVSGSPAQFRAFVEKDIAKWRELGKSVKIEM
jgi:tripartite-type tricarboxylate transporter receptor subunit TctC